MTEEILGRWDSDLQLVAELIAAMPEDRPVREAFMDLLEEDGDVPQIVGHRFRFEDADGQVVNFPVRLMQRVDFERSSD